MPRLKRVQVRHPQNSAHACNVCRHFARSAALGFARKLRAAAEQFRLGSRRLPPELFHYSANRTDPLLAEVERRVLEPDPPGRRCGVPAGA